MQNTVEDQITCFNNNSCSQKKVINIQCWETVTKLVHKKDFYNGEY